MRQFWKDFSLPRIRQQRDVKSTASKAREVEPITLLLFRKGVEADRKTITSPALPEASKSRRGSALKRAGVAESISRTRCKWSRSEVGRCESYSMFDSQ